MGLAKPFFKLTDEPSAARLNSDNIVMYEPVNSPVNGSFGTETTYGISYTLLDRNGSTFKHVTNFSGQAARDAALVVIDAALATTLDETP